MKRKSSVIATLLGSGRLDRVKKTGYHGTTATSADQIISSQKFNQSCEIDEWLGFGIYFFEHYQEADWWSELKERRCLSKKAVLQADLECDAQDYFDMDLFGNAEDVNKLFKIHLDKLSNEGFMIPDFPTKSHMQCYAIEIYKAAHPNIKLISYTFNAPGKRKKGSDVFIPRQRQYCVTDNTIIHNIKYAEAI